MELVIRKAEERDLKAIAELEKSCFSFPHTLEQLKGELDDPLHDLLAAGEGDSLLGYAGLMHVADEGYITNVAVFENARRRGVADALLFAMDDLAEGFQLAFISLEVRSSNLPAIRLYEKHGYLRQAVLPGYYADPKEDAVIMTKYRETGTGV